MLYQQASHTLFAFLDPPDGYALKKLVCTTYSLSMSKVFDLAAMLHIPSEENLSLKDVALLEKGALKKTAQEKLLIYYDRIYMDGSTDVIRQNYVDLFGGCCHRVDMKNAAFHSKLMLACFRKENGSHPVRWYYRLQVGSKNLTDSSAVEFALCMESAESSDEDSKKRTGAVLFHFLGSILSDRPDWHKPLENTAFQHWPIGGTDKGCCTNLRFACNAGNKANIIDTICGELLKDKAIHALSPFLTPDDKGKFYLSEKLQQQVYYKTNAAKTLKDKQADIRKKYKNQVQIASYEFFLHGKLYFWRSKDDNSNRKYRIWLGSANASQNGMENNSEFMVGFDWDAAYYNGNNEDFFKEDDPTKPFILWRYGSGGANGSFYILDDINWDNYREVIDAAQKQRLRWQLGAALKALSATWDGKTLTVSAPDLTDLSMKVDGSTSWEAPVNGTITYTIPPTQKPVGPILPYTAKARINGSEVSVSGCMPLTPTGSDPSFAEPTPLITMLDELYARDAVPKCRYTGFSDVRDCLTERVEAYLASWGFAPEAYKALCARIKNVLAILDQKDCGDPALKEWLEEKNMPQRERAALWQLLKYLSDPAQPSCGLTAYQQATVNHLKEVFATQDAYLAADEVGSGLTTYQQATVNHLKKVFATQDAYLVADEVGMGKTYVAKGLIQAMGYKRILYVASNTEIAKANGPDLIDAEAVILKGKKVYPQVISTIDRLSMYNKEAVKKKQGTDFNKPVVYPLSPATTFTGRGSPEGNQAERDFYCSKCKHNNQCGKHIKDKPCQECNDILRNNIEIFRKKFNDQAVVAFDPDLIILDEFHRFHDLLNPKAQQHYSLYQLIKTINEDRKKRRKENVKIMLLSATPYQYYINRDGKTYEGESSHDDENESSPFQDFSELCAYICALNGVPEQISSENQHPWYNDDYSEVIYNHFLCRTERKWLQGDARDIPTHDLCTWPYNPRAGSPLQPNFRTCARLMPHLKYRDEYQRSLTLIGPYQRADPRCINRVLDSKSLTKANGSDSIQSYGNLRSYLDEAPEYAQFGDGYRTITKGSKGIAKVDDLRDSFSSLLLQSGCRISRTDGKEEPDPSFSEALRGHAKWEALLERAMPEGGELRLWVPPVSAEEDFAKTLVFAHYRVSTRAVAALLSMEAQRRLLDRIGPNPIPLKLDITDETVQELIPWTGLSEKITQDLAAAIRTFFGTTYARRVLTAWAVSKGSSPITERMDKILLDYCREYRWTEMLTEYLECLNKLTGIPEGEALERLLPTLISALDWKDEDRTRVLVLPDWKDTGYPCTYADRYTADYSDKSAHDESDTGNKCTTTNRLSYLMERFQSPFYPFVLTSSETAQEGVNLHNYCDTIFHWSVPSKLTTMVQEEGRVDRRGSLTLRRQAYWIWKTSGRRAPTVSRCFAEMDTAYEALGWDRSRLAELRERGLYPLWFLPADPNWLEEGFPRLHRALFFLPGTEDQQCYESLLDAQADYNTFGITDADGNRILGDDLRKAVCPLFHH